MTKETDNLGPSRIIADRTLNLLILKAILPARQWATHLRLKVLAGSWYGRILCRLADGQMPRKGLYLVKDKICLLINGGPMWLMRFYWAYLAELAPNMRRPCSLSLAWHRIRVLYWKNMQTMPILQTRKKRPDGPCSYTVNIWAQKGFL